VISSGPSSKSSSSSSKLNLPAKPSCSSPSSALIPEYPERALRRHEPHLGPLCPVELERDGREGSLNFEKLGRGRISLPRRWRKKRLYNVCPRNQVRIAMNSLYISFHCCLCLEWNSLHGPESNIVPCLEFRLSVGRTSDMTTPFEIELTAFILYRRYSSDEYRFTGVEIGRRTDELFISS
jgi:hypothetical protein